MVIFWRNGSLFLKSMLTVFKNKTEVFLIVKNFGLLSITKVITLLLPIAIYPFIIDGLGLDSFGNLLLFQSSISFLMIFIGFAFNLSSTKEISLCESRGINISDIVISTFFAKLCISILVLLIYACFFTYIPDNIQPFYLLGYIYIVGELFSCQWFFHGTNRVKELTVITFVVKLVMTIIMFYCLKIGVVALTVGLLYSIEFAIISIICFILLCNSVDFNNYNLKCLMAKSFLVLKNSFSLFSVIFVTSLKDKFNLIVVGAILGPSLVVVFDISLKIITILSLPSSMLSTAAFPVTSRNNSPLLLIKILISSISITTFCYAIFCFSFEAISFLFEGLDSTYFFYIKLIALSSIFLSASVVLANNYLASNSYNKALLQSVLCTTAFYAFSVYLLYIGVFERNVLNLILILLSTYIFELSIRMLYCYLCKKSEIQ